MKVFAGLLIGFLLGPQASASEVNQLYDGFTSPLHLNQRTFEKGKTQRAEDELSGEELMNLSQLLSQRLRDQYGELKGYTAKAFPGCENGAEYLRGLVAIGEYQRCLELANQCMGKASSESVRRLIWYGGVCAWNTFRYDQAFEFFDQVTAPQYRSDFDYSGRVFFFAQFARITQYEGQVESILSRYQPWKKSVNKIMGIIERLKDGHSMRASLEQTKNFVRTHTGTTRSLLTETLVSAWAHYIYRHLDNSNQALLYLKENTEKVLNPENWASVAYNSLYHQRDPYFKLARNIYDAVQPFSHPQSWMPVERNTYDYSELYTEICKDNLLHGSVLAELNELKLNWTTGEIDLVQALDLAQDLDDRNPQKADILSFIAGLFVASGDDSAAIPFYWRANRACPYYNRSHWGLSNIFRRERAEAFNDYEENLSKIDKSLKDIKFPEQMSTYVVNWPSLSADSQERVKYALRLFAPYIDELHEFGSRVYIKQAYELLSEAPGLSSLKDVRINTGTYALDNRLWDDVRGVGGHEMVVSDFGETHQAAFGAYNLAAHEVAHQLHQVARESIGDCIRRLYQGAKEREKFPDPYAASNDHEYFAQGVVYFLTPEDAPQRFGLNVKWLIDNDPDLFNFLKAVKDSEEVEQISCPL